MMDNIGEIMAFILYVGAARASATGQQLEDLRATVLPALEDYRRGDCDRTEVQKAVKSVMGPDWEPAGEWKIWIDNFKGDE